MKNNSLLTITSLVTMLLLSLHLTDDMVRGISPPGRDNVGAVAILLVWLVGTLLLRERRLGYVIMLLGGVFGAAMPVLHMAGKSYPVIARSSGGFFFVWMLLAVGTTGAFAIILAVRALWTSRSGKARASRAD